MSKADKNFDIACQLADDLYFKFIDSTCLGSNLVLMSW